MACHRNVVRGVLRNLLIQHDLVMVHSSRLSFRSCFFYQKLFRRFVRFAACTYGLFLFNAALSGKNGFFKLFKIKLSKRKAGEVDFSVFYLIQLFQDVINIKDSESVLHYLFSY